MNIPKPIGILCIIVGSALIWHAVGSKNDNDTKDTESKDSDNGA